MLWVLQGELADVKNYNFDDPQAFDTPALLHCLEGLKQGKAVDVPTYDFSNHRRGTESKRVSKGCALSPCPAHRNKCNWWMPGSSSNGITQHSTALLTRSSWQHQPRFAGRAGPCNSQVCCRS